MERKLASIQTVLEVNPIVGADAIEQVRILGWSLVAKKGEFKPGDPAVFFEVDSKLPETPTFEFMRKAKFRVRTIRLRGCLSQGLALPVTAFPEIKDAKIGDDVTALLGVTKYEPPETYEKMTDGLTAGVFPGWIHKTDELRVQSFPEVLVELKNFLCAATVKMDGTSATYGIGPDDEFYVCSRNRRLKDSDTNAHWMAAKALDLETRLRAVIPRFGRLALQCEVCGPGIQGNRVGLKGLQAFCFNLYSVDEGRFYDHDDFLTITAVLDVPTVPRLPNFVLDHTVEQLLEMARGNYDNGKPREGIVVRPVFERYSRVLCGRTSFKAINNDFLLEYGL